MAAKKILTGCLVVVLVLVVGLGLAWWFVLRPMWQAGVEGATAWVSAVDLGDDIVNRAPFEAPDDGRMSQAQVDDFVKVQSVVARELGPDLAVLAQRTQAAAEERSSGAAETSLADVGTAYRELSGLLSRLRAAQAKGVNEVGMSRDEYAWVRRQSLVAMRQLVDLESMPGLPGIPGLPGGLPLPGAGGQDDAAAKHNAALLRPHLPLLQKTLGPATVIPGA
ncbi:hypothetical protein [Arenimonas alkanexedens]